jgi:hypothetical protein
VLSVPGVFKAPLHGGLQEMRVASNIDNEDNVTKELEIPFLNPNSLNKEKKTALSDSLIPV